MSIRNSRYMLWLLITYIYIHNNYIKILYIYIFIYCVYIYTCFTRCSRFFVQSLKRFNSCVSRQPSETARVCGPFLQTSFSGRDHHWWICSVKSAIWLLVVGTDLLLVWCHSFPIYALIASQMIWLGLLFKVDTSKDKNTRSPSLVRNSLLSVAESGLVNQPLHTGVHLFFQDLSSMKSHLGPEFQIIYFICRFQDNPSHL